MISDLQEARDQLRAALAPIAARVDANLEMFVIYQTEAEHFREMAHQTGDASFETEALEAQRRAAECWSMLAQDDES